ncbi:hypothetical protein ACHAWF_014595, partial [Thalassiosira exigua]
VLGLSQVEGESTDRAGSCSRRTRDLAADCEAKFSVGRYTSGIYVERTKGSAVLGTNPQTSVDNGALIPIRIAKFTDSSGFSFFDANYVPRNTTTWSGGSSICSNALRRLTYSVRYNHTKIVDISAVIEADIEDVGEEHRQEFAVQFEPVEFDPSRRSHERNNLIARIRSGNPGYVAGKPVLGGMSPNTNSTSSYVIAQKAGFTVMDTGVGGQCASSSPTGSTVGFGKNMIVSCTQPFTREELKKFCLASQHPLLTSRAIGADNFVYPKWLGTEQDLLGIFGNADPLARDQWIEIESASDDPGFSIKSRSFLEGEGRCVGMPSRLRFEMLWTYVGNVESPQAKILSAKKSFEYGPTLQHVLPPKEKQPYSFATTVSWTFLQPKYGVVKSPPPTLIFSVPHDVFYPFQMNSGRSVSSLFSLLILSAAVAMLAVV